MEQKNKEKCPKCGLALESYGICIDPNCNGVSKTLKFDSMCKQAVEKWGVDSQARMAVEELLECAIEIHRFASRGRGSIENIAEEIADVRICLRQIELIIGEEVCQQAHKEKMIKFQRHLDR